MLSLCRLSTTEYNIVIIIRRHFFIGDAFWTTWITKYKESHQNIQFLEYYTSSGDLHFIPKFWILRIFNSKYQILGNPRSCLYHCLYSFFYYFHPDILLTNEISVRKCKSSLYTLMCDRCELAFKFKTTTKKTVFSVL